MDKIVYANLIWLKIDLLDCLWIVHYTDISIYIGKGRGQRVLEHEKESWYVCKDAPDKLPRKDVQLTSQTQNRVFFVDIGFEHNKPRDEAENFYLHKSIAG